MDLTGIVFVIGAVALLITRVVLFKTSNPLDTHTKEEEKRLPQMVMMLALSMIMMTFGVLYYNWQFPTTVVSTSITSNVPLFCTGTSASVVGCGTTTETTNSTTTTTTWPMAGWQFLYGVLFIVIYDLFVAILMFFDVTVLMHSTIKDSLGG